MSREEGTEEKGGMEDGGKEEETKEAHSFPEAVIEADWEEKAIQSKGEFNFADL
ncbi:hypothetical protein GCM10027036_19460 [Flavihumibacter cheonanensis]|uniref:hypothetical protein n=1 Tax=Flavihumibacter cheonanensis TaxID=1442385 RepID=UPI001EF7CD4A|nr:hypothetical protein [Flavihumibacter cheonanensis]MCG7754079.1 hypothetical protein [Flavihumibacter cheonanensis]